MRLFPIVAIGGLALVLLAVILYRQSPVGLTTDDWWRLGYLTMFLSFFALAAGGRQIGLGELGRQARVLAIWGAVLLGLVALYSLRDTFSGLAADVMAELSPSGGIVTGKGEVLLAAGADGHFRADVEMNGVVVRVMVDTGASDIALTRADAKRIGFDVATLDYTRPYLTANGVAMSAPVVLKTVRIGGIVLHDVPASVAGTELHTSLLGMSFLRRLGAVEMTPTRLTLRR